MDEDERQWGSEWQRCVCGLTTWSFMLHLYLFLKGASHGLHLTWVAVSVPIAAANRVLVLRTRIWAFAHRLAVLHHAHGSKLTGLLQARALQVKICPKKQRNKLSFNLEEERKDKEEGERVKAAKSRCYSTCQCLIWILYTLRLTI